MSSTALGKITIEHLRGSVVPFSLPFEKGKNLSVVYGENGTGKSTICDAFELLGKGKVGSLENRGLGQTGRYWPSVGKTRGDVSVTLETANGAKCKGTIGKGNDVLVQPTDGRPRVEVLRRRQILSLVEAKPADRYNEIKRFIDVSAIEESEGVLRELIRDLTQRRGEAVARVDENGAAIRQFWESAGRPKPDEFSWADSECRRDTTAFGREIEAIRAVQTAYSRLTEYPQLLKSASEAVKSARETESTTSKQAEQAAQRIATDAEEVVRVLEAAQAYLAKVPSPPACPLCESSEKTADLANRIAQRLQGFSSLRTVQAQRRTTSEALRLAENRLNSLHENATRHTAEFAKSLANSDLPKDISLPASSVPTDFSSLSGWLASTAHLPAEWKKAETARYEKKQFIETLVKALKTWRDNTTAQKNLDAMLPRLTKALKATEEERRLFTDTILVAISSGVGRLYEAVHPGEGLNKISLQLDPDRRASLDFGASFGNLTATPPQAYFSDSHLDTLGLCVFLALSALDQPKDTILILDDILGSVDEPHVERLIEMLYSETKKFRHALLTTHYRPWKQKLRWGWLKNGQCQFIELSKWTSASGLTTIRSVPDVERLKQLLAETPPDPQLVCSKAGVILEAALDFITQLYECPVPRRQGGAYTLGDLLTAIDKRLRQAFRIEVLAGRDAANVPIYKTANLGPLLDELTRIAQARNVFGCHFSEISFDLLESDALGFGQQVLQLMELLTDKEAGWPRNDRSGEYWATAQETRKLYPFKRPT